MHDAAGASLVVAMGLLMLAVAARTVRWAGIAHTPAQDLASQYLGPLGTWCLITAGANAFAVGATGDANVLSLALPLGLGAAAVLLRGDGDPVAPAAADAAEERPAADRPAPEPAPAATTPVVPPRAPEPRTEPADARRPESLWSRA